MPDSPPEKAAGILHPRSGTKDAPDKAPYSIQFREIQHIAVCILSSGHDARDGICHIHIDRNARKIFLLADLNLTVRTHTADEEYIEPVTGKLSAVFAGQTIITEQSLHRVDVFKGYIGGGRFQIGVEGEVVLGQASVRNALHNRGANRIGCRSDLLDHVVQQIVKDMPGVYRDLIQFRHHAVDAERLIAQLTGFNHIVLKADMRGSALLLGAHIGKILRGHIAMLAVRAGDFIPAGRGFLDDDDLCAFLVLAQNLILRACAGAQTKRIIAGSDLVDLHIVGRGLVLLRDQIDLRSHRGRHRHTQDVAVCELAPLVMRIQRMNKRHFPFAIQSFRNCTRRRADCAHTVV